MQLLKTFFALIMLALAVSAVGCVSTKHKQDKLTAQFNKLKAKADADKDLAIIPVERCAIWYVPKIVTKTTTKYLPGKPIRTNSVEYVTVDCDSVVATVKKNLSVGVKSSIVKVPVPVYVRVDTSAILQEVDRENVAGLVYRDSLIAAQSRRLADKDIDIAKEHEVSKGHQKNAVKWRGRFGYLLGINIGLIALFIGYRWLRGQYVKKANAVKDLIS